MRNIRSKKQGNTKSNFQSTNSSGNELIPIIQNGNSTLVDARLLHQVLEVGRDFPTWFKKRIDQYSFELGIDYFPCSPVLGSVENQDKGDFAKYQLKKDYNITLDMAKELAMLERNPIGKSVRKYFIEAEKMSRTQVLQEEQDGPFKGIKPVIYRGLKCYPYLNVLKALGYSAKSGTVQARKIKFPGQFFKLFGRNFITASFADFLLEGRKLLEDRKKMQMALPFTKGGAAC